MALLQRRVKSALLVDFDNIEGRVGKPFGQNIQAWLSWFEDGAFSKSRRRRSFVATKVYWNGQTDKHRASFEQHGFEAFACRSQAAVKIRENKSSADIVITIDAMDLVHEVRGLREVVLLTADTDFVPLVNRLQLKGLNVVVVGNEADPSSAIFRDRGAEVVSVAELTAACSYTSPRPRKAGPSPMPTSAPVPTPAARATEVSAAPARTATPTPAPAKRKRKRKKAHPSDKAQEYDLEMAARQVLQVCMQTPNRPASKAALDGALSTVPNFSKTPTKQQEAWLGCGNLDGLLRSLANAEPRLHVSKNPQGRALQVKFVGELPHEPGQGSPDVS